MKKGKKVTLKFISKVGKRNKKGITYTRELIEKIINQTKDYLPLNLYDFRDKVTPEYLHKPLEYQNKLKESGDCIVGKVVDLYLKDGKFYIDVELTKKVKLKNKDTFSMNFLYDNETGDARVHTFYISDEEIRGNLIKKLIEKAIKESRKIDEKEEDES